MSVGGSGFRVPFGACTVTRVMELQALGHED